MGYPAQLLPQNSKISSRDGDRYGLWSDGQHGWGGLVRAQMADGSARLAQSCASCHAGLTPDGRLVSGAPNTRLDLGALLADSEASVAVEESELAHAAVLRAWGRGRVDVTTDTGALPVRLPDLRPLRWLGHLHYAATVRQLNIASLAIRIETQLIVSHQQALRPPREIALGLATFLWSLGDTLPTLAASDAASAEGAAIVEARCRPCHEGPGLTGAPVAAELVGTPWRRRWTPGGGRGSTAPVRCVGSAPGDPCCMTGPYPIWTTFSTRGDCGWA